MNMQVDMDTELELETKRQTFANIASAAKEAFANHRLVKLDSRIWACADPNSGFYAFYVAELPGAIALWGDIGSLMIDAGTGYNVEWLRGAIKSYRYILEKSSQAKQTHFYSGEFKDYLDGEDDVLVGNDWSETAFHEYRWKTGDCDSADAVYGHTRDSLWCYQALSKFVELLNESQS